MGIGKLLLKTNADSNQKEKEGLQFKGTLIIFKHSIKIQYYEHPEKPASRQSPFANAF